MEIASRRSFADSLSLFLALVLMECVAAEPEGWLESPISFERKESANSLNGTLTASMSITASEIVEPALHRLTVRVFLVLFPPWERHEHRSYEVEPERSRHPLGPRNAGRRCKVSVMTTAMIVR